MSCAVGSKQHVPQIFTWPMAMVHVLQVGMFVMFCVLVLIFDLDWHTDD